MVQALSQRLSFDEYLAYNDDTDNQYEWVDGELVLMTPPTGLHQIIITFLLVQFYNEIQRLGLGWQVHPSGSGVRTMRGRSRLPDLSVMTAEQSEGIRERSSVLESAPLLVVEIVSPESVKRDYRSKRTEYAALGIPEYWIVDPLMAKVSILTLDEGFYDVAEFCGDERLVSPTFVGLMLTAQQVLGAKL
jgi:Uma2 family endonuclease